MNSPRFENTRHFQQTREGFIDSNNDIGGALLRSRKRRPLHTNSAAISTREASLTVSEDMVPFKPALSVNRSVTYRLVAFLVQTIVLVGPSAAGKSTLLSCLAGTTEVTQGDALICGQSVRYSYEFGNGGKVGFCPQGDVRSRGPGLSLSCFFFSDSCAILFPSKRPVSSSVGPESRAVDYFWG